jgi:hypothetical protein
MTENRCGALVAMKEVAVAVLEGEGLLRGHSAEGEGPPRARTRATDYRKRGTDRKNYLAIP